MNGAPPTSGDLERTRAVLRLLFENQTADRLAARASLDETQLIRASVRRWTFERWLGRLARRSPDQTTPPLSPLLGASATGAVALAFQLGLGASVARIAEATGTSAEQIGKDLYAARQLVSTVDMAACGEFTSSIGRYRDSSLEIAERAAMLHHIQRCSSCRTAYERIQTVDAQLIDRVERDTLSLEPAIDEDYRKARVHVWRWAAGAVVVVLVATVATVILMSQLRSSSSNRPVAISGGQPTLSGWLLSASSDGQVMALNLATGRNRMVVPAEANPPDLRLGLTQTLLSPDGRFIARQEPVTKPQPHTELTIFSLDGTSERKVDLRGQGRFILSGWLTNDTVLEISQPSEGQNQPLGSYVTGLQNDSAVLAVDTASGTQREMLRGSVQRIYLSPDRSLVVVETWSSASGGQLQIDLRPIQNGKIGDAISSTYAQIGMDPVWAPDSSRVYISPTDDRSGAPTATDTSSTIVLESGNQRQRIASWDRSGRMTLLSPLTEGAFTYPIAASPDGQQLISVTGSYNTAAGASRYQIWRTTATGDDAVALAGASPFQIPDGLWSPNGDILILQYVRPFIIGPSVDNVVQGTVLSSSTVAVFPDGHSVTVRTLLEADLASGYLAWLPANTFSDAATASSGGHTGQVSTVDQLSEGRLEAEPSSQSSGDGQYVTLRDSSTDTPIIWDRSAGSGRRLAEGATGLSWLPQGDQLIAVGTLEADQPNGFSRLMTFAPTFGTTIPQYDYRAYDPANIGTSSTITYADPAFTPDENTLAFFTVDDQGTVALWLVSFDDSAKLVYQWAVPTDSKVDAEPISAWVDNQTLIFAEPSDWHGGLPGKTLLQRLTIQPDGTAQIETLTTLDTHGNERGVNLEEFALSSTSGRIAYRLRHFTQSSTTNGAFDSVDIITLDHPGSPIEVSRQGTGSGLNWSPDGNVLAAPVSGQIRFYSSVGDLLGTVTGFDDQSSPVWVNSSEVWFNASVDGRQRVMSVQVH